MAHPAGAASLSRSLGPGWGRGRPLRAHPKVGTVLEGSSAVRSSAGGCFPRGWRCGPTRRAPSGVVAERQLSCRARVPPHATLPGRGAPGVQLRGDLRPGEASPPKPDDPLTDLLGYRPPTSHTPIVPLRLEAVAGPFPLPTNTCLSRSGPVCCFYRAGREDAYRGGGRPDLAPAMINGCAGRRGTRRSLLRS
jgi:hypothetical protein